MPISQLSEDNPLLRFSFQVIQVILGYVKLLIRANQLNN